MPIGETWTIDVRNLLNEEDRKKIDANFHEGTIKAIKKKNVVFIEIISCIIFFHQKHSTVIQNYQIQVIQKKNWQCFWKVI